MIPPSAKETTEQVTSQVTSALKSLYTNAASVSFQCGDSYGLRLPSECSAMNNNDRGADAIELDWRCAADQSMSDLTLVIYDGSGGTPYHVHTLLLAFGGRKSAFVAEQLKQQQQKKKNVKEYKIEIYVPPLAARFVPTFLDYIYGSGLDSLLNTDSAPSLRYLANRFDVKELQVPITKFLPKDLDLSTAPKYCMAADTLKDYELRDKALRIMAERMERMDGRYLKHLSPRLMRSLVQCNTTEQSCSGQVLSEKVAQWLRVREEQDDDDNAAPPAPLSDEDFYWITHIQHMPQISPHEALFYLNYGSNFPSVMSEIGPGSLKHRCLVATSGRWAMNHLVAHLEHPDDVPMTLYDELDRELKVQLLEGALVGAKKLGQETAAQSSVQEGVERDVKLSNEMMYSNLTAREQECSKNGVSSRDKCEKVVVLGCGIASANGVYLADNAQSVTMPLSNISSPRNNIQSPKSTTVTSTAVSSDPTYEKQAIWNGSRVTFVLMPVKSGKYYTHYKLCVRQNNNNNTSTATRVLYTSPTSTGSESIRASIPEYGWEVENDDTLEEDGDNTVYPPPLFVGRIAGGRAGSNN